MGSPHFGRAAERLHVSVARVSQAIKKQERAIGAELFARNSHSVRLTRLGEQLRDDLRHLHQGLTQSLERARQAARGVTGTLCLGMIPGNVHAREGTVDVLVTWLPVEEPDLTVGPVLFTDPRVLAVATDHELATRPIASIEMLADFLHTDAPLAPGYWADGFIPPHTPRGHRIVRGPRVTHMEELLALVSVGEVVNSLPAHSARYWNRPDIAWLPFHDFEALTYALVWCTEAETDAVRALGPLHLGRPLWNP
ncbi:LysR family transcriptional regulator [Nonomuraea mangrovi]|uniref:LysR family transcriptional regulator n=1 Tax=Nonomuraea mangrovi TaxID=2316207 RepID=A0ABW4SRJ1_9ACTN